MWMRVPGACTNCGDEMARTMSLVDTHTTPSRSDDVTSPLNTCEPISTRGRFVSRLTTTARAG